MTSCAKPPYGKGIYRRRILLRARPGCVVADLEDDFHRFRVTLEHDGAQVGEVQGEALRYPWTACPGAVEPLRALRGMPLSARTTAAAAHTDLRANCTHLFDLAGLAVTHAHAGRARRDYAIEIPDAVGGATRATLHRDGQLLLEWQLKSTRIAEPAPYRNVDLRGGAFLRWAEGQLDADTAEAAIVLRRACFISAGRRFDLDEAADASVYFAMSPGSCHTFSEGVAQHALRMRGATLDFSHRPETLLADADA